ncbi:MAG TPA: hypothetical protein VFX92_14135 [Candidatus Krumholzibacteria bacterium]|nr:hypothetical protein [Candidatus Krumholzibacteria bacterium]
MRRPLFFFLAVLLLGVAGCGKGQSGDSADGQTGSESAPSVSSQLPPADVTAKPGDAVVAAPGEEFPVDGLYLNPYFDEAGTQTEMAVAPNAQFKFYVFAETAEPYSTNGTQYRLSLPEGIQILGTDEFEHRSVSTGTPTVNYMQAYECQPPSRFRLVTYICTTTPDFKGGEIQVLDGLPATGINFIGFTSCDFVEMRAAGGSATLTRK